MVHKDTRDRRRWAGLAAVAALLAVCLILLGVGTPGGAMADDAGPLPRWPALDRGDATRPALLGVEAAPLPALPMLGPRQAIPLGFTVDVTYDALWGLVGPGDLVTVTRTADGAYGAAQADGVGFFWTSLWQTNGQPADVAGGDILEVYVNGSLAWLLAPRALTGSIDVLADQVLGHIVDVGAFMPVTVTVGTWGDPPSAGAPQQTTTTDANGDWSVTFGDVDLGAETLVAVDHGGAGSYVRTYLYPNDPVFLVQQFRQVVGYAPPFQTVTATVYSAYPGDVRWQVTGEADYPHGFYDLRKPGEEDDAQPGDVVEVEFEDGTLLSTTLFDLRDLSFDTFLEQVSGVAPQGELVRASMWQLAGDELLYSQALATAAPGDTFQATFAPADLRPRDEVTVAIADGQGHQTQLSSGAPFLDAFVDPLSEMDCLVWRVDGPGLPVTLTLEIAPGEVYTRENPLGPSDAGNGGGGYCALVWGPDWGPINFTPGSTVTIQSPTWEGSVVVADVSWQADSANDEVSGEAPPGDLEVAVSQWQGDGYPLQGSAVQTAMAASPFSVQFATFDVRDGSVVQVRHFDPGTDFASRHNAWGSLETHYFEVQPPYGVGGVPPSADEPVTAWLYDVDGTTLLASTSDDGDGDPWRFWLEFAEDEPQIEPGYWLTLTSEGGWAAGLQVPSLTVEADEATDLAWGEGPKSSVFVEHASADGWDGHWVPVDGYVLDWGYFGGDIQPGDRIYTVYPHPTGNRVYKEHKLGEVLRAEFWLKKTGHTEMWGEAQPGSTVTVTTPLTQVYAWADPSCGGCWNLYAGLVYPGDNVIVEASPGNDPVAINIPEPLTAEADSAIAQVWGQIGGWSEQMVEIHGNWDGGYQEVTTDATGNYQASYGWMPRGADGYVRFVDQYNYTEVIFHRPFLAPDLLMYTNYGDDWVEGYYEPGHTLWLTVTDGFGTVKATAELQTQEIPWWGGETGFSTNLGDPWVPARPNLEVGDWVYGQMDNGYSSAARMGDIQGTLDTEADTIAGNIYADWFTETLVVRCEVWEEGGPGMELTVDPDGGSYFCDFGALGWDLQPGHDVAVQYEEPDRDRVINVFEPPWMRVNYGHDWVGGDYPTGHTFWLTVTDEFGAVKATATMQSEGGGGWGGDGFETQWDDWSPEQPDIQAGDWAHFRADDGYNNAMRVGEIQGTLDLDADTLSGNIYADWFTETLTVYCEVWEEGGPSFEISGVDPDGGSYVCDLGAAGWDLKAGDQVAVHYEEPDDADRVINIFQSPWMRVNYGDDWVGGNYPAGHGLWLIVTDESGAFKASATVQTEAGGGWGGDGFETGEDDWSPQPPDIQAGDSVHFQSDDGYSNTIQVGDIRGTVDLDDDSVRGPVYAEWFAETLEVQCSPWGAPEWAPDKYSSAAPDGSVPYACQWDPDTEWDIQANQRVAVMYIEPDDADRVINVFEGGYQVYLPVMLKSH